MSRFIDAAGLTTLTIPTLIAASSGSAIYSILLLLEGLGLTYYGIKTQRKKVIWWAIGAICLSVFVSTYKYFVGIPSWVFFGICGILVVLSAIYLISKEKHSK